jgi:hypothetical protein
VVLIDWSFYKRFYIMSVTCSRLICSKDRRFIYSRYILADGVDPGREALYNVCKMLLVGLVIRQRICICRSNIADDIGPWLILHNVG